VSNLRVRPIWTPEDAAALAAAAAQYSTVIGESVALDYIVDSEHLS
jgi:hypothetical protein